MRRLHRPVQSAKVILTALFHSFRHRRFRAADCGRLLYEAAGYRTANAGSHGHLHDGKELRSSVPRNRALRDYGIAVEKKFFAMAISLRLSAL